MMQLAFSSWSLEARGALAGALCLAVGLLAGKRAIAWLKKHFREPIKSISPTVTRLHQHKAATPTMGGLLLVVGILVATFAFGSWHDPCIWTALATLILFAAVGAIDDLTKLWTERRGISMRAKLICQGAAALFVASTLALIDSQYGGWHIPLTLFVLITAANAVNLTDGLDGLAGGCAFVTTAAMAIVLSAAASEMTVIAGATAGSLAAFLWFNRHPARVFMGDTGSQSLGALLGLFAIIVHQEWLLAIVGGVFVIEIASVVIQLMSYRLRGKRFFLCAPLHHHFQFLGWSEPKIVRHFWIAAVGCASIGMFFLHVASTPVVATNPGVVVGNLSPSVRVQSSEATKETVLRVATATASQGRNH